MDMPRVVNVRKAQTGMCFADWLSRPKSVYIGREVRWVDGTFNSVWGNYGKLSHKEYTRRLLQSRPELLGKLESLSGKELGCWCVVPEKHVYCHGQAVCELFARHVNQQMSHAALTAWYAE